MKSPRIAAVAASASYPIMSVAARELPSPRRVAGQRGFRPVVIVLTPSMCSITDI